MSSWSRKGAAALAIAAGAALPACVPEPVPAKSATQPVLAVATSAPVAPGAALTPVVAPVDLPPMAALARRLAAVIDGAKPQVTTYSLDLSALPRVTVPATLDAKTASKLDRTKLTDDAEINVKPADGYARQYMLSFSFKDAAKVSFGHIRVNGQYGINDGWFGEGFGNQMNAYMTCGGTSELLPIHWETLKIADGQVNYTIADGVLDRQSCRILSVQKSTATAKPLLPNGILYGFRGCEISCSENENLTVLFPRASASAAGALGGGAEHATGSFSAVSFPIQRGGGGAFVARLLRRDVVSWSLQAASKAQDKPTTLLADEDRLNSTILSSFEIGIEVSQTNDDEKPLAIAYMDVDPATLPVPAPPKSPAPAAAPKAQAPASGSPLPSRIGFNSLDNALDSRR